MFQTHEYEFPKLYQHIFGEGGGDGSHISFSKDHSLKKVRGEKCALLHINPKSNLIEEALSLNLNNKKDFRVVGDILGKEADTQLLKYQST